MEPEYARQFGLIRLGTFIGFYTIAICADTVLLTVFNLFVERRRKVQLQMSAPNHPIGFDAAGATMARYKRFLRIELILRMLVLLPLLAVAVFSLYVNFVWIPHTFSGTSMGAAELAAMWFFGALLTTGLALLLYGVSRRARAFAAHWRLAWGGEQSWRQLYHWEESKGCYVPAQYIFEEQGFRVLAVGKPFLIALLGCCVIVLSGILRILYAYFVYR